MISVPKWEAYRKKLRFIPKKGDDTKTVKNKH